MNLFFKFCLSLVLVSKGCKIELICLKIAYLFLLGKVDMKEVVKQEKGGERKRDLNTENS